MDPLLSQERELVEEIRQRHRAVGRPGSDRECLLEIIDRLCVLRSESVSQQGFVAIVHRCYDCGKDYAHESVLSHMSCGYCRTAKARKESDTFWRVRFRRQGDEVRKLKARLYDLQARLRGGA